jgi:copper chaperone CopZ
MPSVSTVVVVIVVAIGLFFGLRRIAASTSGKSCCTDGGTVHRVKKVAVEDTDPGHYPYEENFLIGGMSCEGCAENVTNALNGVAGTLAAVDLKSRVATVRAKRPIERAVYEQAVKDAGYSVMRL